MAGELGEAAQAVNVGINGVQVAMKGSKEAIEKMAQFIWFLLKHTTLKDKERLKKFLEEPGSKVVAEFNDNDKKDVLRDLKKLGINYVELPDLNKDDNVFGIWVNQKDMNFLTKITEKYTHHIYNSQEEYLSKHPEYEGAIGSDAKDMSLLPVAEIAQAVRGKENGISIEDLKKEMNVSSPEKHEDFDKALDILKNADVIKDEDGKLSTDKNFNETLAIAMQSEDFAISRGAFYAEDENYVPVKAKKSLILAETPSEIKDVFQDKLFSSNIEVDVITKEAIEREFKDNFADFAPYVMPGTNGKKVVLIPRDEICAEIKDESANEFFLNKQASYSVFDFDNGKFSKIKGEKLQREHFNDPLFGKDGITEQKKDRESRERNNYRKKKNNSKFFKNSTKNKKSTPVSKVR